MRPKRPSPILALVVATGCQAIWGDFRVDDSAVPREPGNEICNEAGKYRCDGARLWLCFEPPAPWTKLVDCEAGQECNAEQGTCSDSNSSSGGSGGEAGSSDESGGTTRGGANGTGGGTNGGESTGARGGAPAVTGGGGNAGAAAAAGDQAGGEPSGTGATGSGASGGAGCEPGTPGCERIALDSCPLDPEKTEPGACGCGVVDTRECAVLRAALAQRYSFDGTGTTLVNELTDQHGELVNTALTGTGALALAGSTSDEYADLPNGLVASLVNASFEVWLTWRGGAAWQRVFDFGSNQNAEGSQGTGASYLFFTPMAANATGFARVAFTASGNAAETKLDAPRALTVGAVSHVAVVVDDAQNLLSLYLDGLPQGSVPFTGQLASLKDVNNWLGRSQYSADPELNALLDEFRIYRAALTPLEVAASFAAGPNPAFLRR